METKEKNAMIVQSDEHVGMVAELTGDKLMMYTSLKFDTPEEKAKLFNSMNSPDARVGDMVGKTIKIKDVFAEQIELVNEETGEINIAPRIVIIDENGKTFQAVSVGIFSAIKKLFMIFGHPTYSPGIPVEIKQINRGAHRILTFDVLTK